MIQIQKKDQGYTLISNDFIDRYMVTAGSSHLKTYLLLNRLMGDAACEITVSGMADILDCSESDIIRSLRYWEKNGLMKLSFRGAEGEKKVLEAIEILPIPRVQKEGKVEVVSEKSLPVEAKTEENPAVNPELSQKADVMALAADVNFGRVSFVAEQYIGKPLSQWEVERLAWMYDVLKMEPALIEYLVESCVTNGHSSIRYMEKVAMDWHSKRIVTVEQAKIYQPLHNKNLYTVMKALGLSDRQPGLAEKQYFDRWFNEMGFSLDLVVEACNRTMISIHKPDFKYVESILERWKDAGVSKIEELKALDEAHQKKAAVYNKNQTQTPAKTANGQAKKPGGRFHEFGQRNIDYDALLKQRKDRKNDQED